MNKKIHILLLFIMGVFLIPSVSFACGSSCGGEKTTKIKTKGCCASKNDVQHQSVNKGCCDSSKSSKQDKGCGGKCKHNSCHCTAPVLSLILPSFSELTINHFDFSNKKKSFTFEKLNISSGFYYIWTPPNIG